MSKRTPPLITHADWNEALAAVGATPLTAEDPNARTSNELAEIWGCTRDVAYKAIVKLIRAGKATATRKLIPRGNGHATTTAYVLAKDK